MSEGLGAGATGEGEGPPAHLKRSASVDAVHEGARGRLRSLAWRARSTSKKGILIFCFDVLYKPRGTEIYLFRLLKQKKRLTDVGIDLRKSINMSCKKET